MTCIKTENPEGTAQVDFEFIVQSYFDTLLRYVLSVTFCRAVVLNRKPWIKRHLLSTDEVIRCA